MNDWMAANWALLIAILVAASALLLVAALLLLALWLRSRREARRAHAQRVEAERTALDLELLAAEQGSRMTIVRELHELVVHSISVIVSQADGARYAAAADPAVAARTSTHIAEAARSTLADLRRVMDVVRDGEAAAGPQPRLSSVRELLKVMRDAGLVIEFTETGDRLDLRQGAELAVYRILQEALANALRHGGEGTSVRVAFTWTAEGLELLVDDDGVLAAARRRGEDPDTGPVHVPTQEDDLAALTRPPSGRGMTEMRERTELFGGVLTAHAIPGVGFRVSAAFPGLRHHNGVHATPLGRP